MLIALLLLAASVAQPPLAPLTDTYPTSKGTAGVSFALPSGGGQTVGFTYFLNNDLAATVDLGLDATFSPSGTPAGFSLGIALRVYEAKHDRVGVFLQPSVGFGRDRTAQAEFLTFGGALGVEYFFTNNFSVGGTLGLGLNLNNIGAPGSPPVGVELTTATSGLFASIYF